MEREIQRKACDAIGCAEQATYTKFDSGFILYYCAHHWALLQEKGKAKMSSPGFSQEQWTFLLNQSIKQIHSLATLKGGEYAGDSDRLANFRRNGEALGLPMETVWAVYAAKHWDAVMQFIKDWHTGKERKRLEPIEGRVDDLLVYLLLFKAMLQERNPQPHPLAGDPIEAQTFAPLDK